MWSLFVSIIYLDIWITCHTVKTLLTVQCADCSSSGGVHHSSRCAAPCCIHYWKYFIKLLMLLWLVFIDNQNYGLVFVQRIFMYDRSVVNFFWSDVFKSNLFSWLSLKSEILENVLLSDFFRPNFSDVWPPHSSCSSSFFIILFICKQNTCRVDTHC